MSIAAIGAAISGLFSFGKEYIKEPEKQIEFQNKVVELQSAAMQHQAETVQAEIKGESWLQRNWRPMLMTTITIIIFNNYVVTALLMNFGIDVIPMELPGALWTLMDIGVGGYVGGRSGEKIAKIIKSQK